MANGSGILQRLFGGPSSALLTPEQRGQAERGAIRDFGLALLANSAAEIGRPAKPLGAAIALGTMAGRESYERFVGQSVATRNLLRERETEEEIADILEGPDLSVEGLELAFKAALRGGDIESARTIGPLLQSQYDMTAAATAAAGKSNVVTKENPETGLLMGIDQDTGQVVWEQRQDMDTIAPALRDEAQKIVSDYESQSKATRDVANSYLRVLTSSKDLIEHQQREIAGGGTGKPPIAATMALISSYARLLDPGSVVRTEEFKIVSNIGGFMDKLKSWFSMAESGTMPPDIAQSIQDHAFRQTAAQHQTLRGLMESARQNAMNLGIDPDHITLVDPFADALSLPRTGPGKVQTMTDTTRTDLVNRVDAAAVSDIPSGLPADTTFIPLPDFLEGLIKPIER